MVSPMDQSDKDVYQTGAQGCPDSFPKSSPSTCSVSSRAARIAQSQPPHAESWEIVFTQIPLFEAMAANNLFPSFLDTPNSSPSANSNSTNNGPLRLSPSSLSSPQQNQSNGNGIANGLNGLPVNAGQQMDVNFLYQKVLELSEALRENREKTQGIVNGAEELATRAAANGAAPSLRDANAEVSSVRIADLERRLLISESKVSTLQAEQKENTELIGAWGSEVGKLVEKVRDHTFDNKQELLAQAKRYNELLQEEKDQHLQARLEKDEWHSRFMRCVAMMREAFRLRCEEEEGPVRVVSGLQNEVRALRSAMGMDKEREEDEYGWEILKDVDGLCGVGEAGLGGGGGGVDV